MIIRQRVLLVAAAATVALVGCSTAPTEDKRSASSTTAAAASQAQKQEAQQIAEDAEKIMLDPVLAPKDKYPKALAMFRNALKIDPDNALSKNSIKLIEDIYKSMGRPVPETT